MNLIGPIPADTLFTPKYLTSADAVLTMFHDQGLPVLKSQGFGNAANITLSLLNASWPLLDENALTRDEIEIVVQVNGKVRAKLSVLVDAGKDVIETTALEHENVLRFTEGLTVRKVIVVPGKLVNVVAN